MKKMFAIVAVAAALSAVPAAAATGEGRVEARGSYGWAKGGVDDFFGGVAAGYDVNLGEKAFIGPEVSYDTNFDGADLLNLGGRVGAKVGENGKFYVGAGYEVADADAFNLGAGYQHSFTKNVYGKVEYRHFFLNGTDFNAAGVGLGVKF